MTGFVLLFAVACLGGVIATVGDRIGMKVGKSRLSLFNLRPRQTATVVSVATGMLASFSTLMLLIALDDQLRKGLFQLDDIQQELSQAQTDLESTRTEKESAEATLAEAMQQQVEAQASLRETNQSLRTAVSREEETLANLVETQAQLETVSEQAGGLRGEIEELRTERAALVEEQAAVRSQIAQRDQEIAQRNDQLREQSAALANRDQELSDRDGQIAQRDQEIAQREDRLEELQAQQQFLDQQIARLEDDFDNLRLGAVAISRNQVLVDNVVMPTNATEAQAALQRALLEANIVALQAVWPGISAIEDFVLLFNPVNFNQIIEATADGREHVLIVSSEANYVVGEPCINEILNQDGEACLLVDIESVLNEVIYDVGYSVASVQIEASDFSDVNLRERLQALGARVEIQANRDGILNPGPIVARGQSEPILAFLRQVQGYGKPLQIQAIASQPAYTVGPVYLDLMAVQNGQVLFSTTTVRQSSEPRLPIE